ncbi:MAG: 50S ribosomal protein L24 [bacterium]|nr:50S ribosomal protein L24 [bacterium]
MKIKKGDTVLIISGKDKGRKSKILQVLSKEQKIVIEGVNIRKKHIKPRKTGEKGQIIETPGPLHISNVKLICRKCGKPIRVGYKITDGKKFRICKKCGQEI